MSSTLLCPKCNAPRPALASEADIECRRCGIIYAKFRTPAPKPAILSATKAPPRAPGTPLKAYPPWQIAAVCAGTLGVAWVIGSMRYESDMRQELRGSGGKATMAFVQCKDFVRGHAFAPSTADFAFLDFQAKAQGNETYRIYSTVTAQNAFGAPLKKNFSCTARFNGGNEADPRNWTLVGLEIY